MRQKRLVLPALSALLLLALSPAASSAQASSPYAAGLTVGLGGASGAEPSTDYGNFGFQAFFSMEVQTSTRFVVRLGQQGLESKDSSVDADLGYLTLAGEYMFNAGLYKSGLFMGLGAYDLSGSGVEDDSALGLSLGTTGDFRLTDRLNLRVELSGHYADLDYAHFFVMVHAGVAYHF